MRPPFVCRPAVGATRPPKARVVGEARAADEPREPPWNAIPIERRVESFADDLNMRQGIVSGRVALLPRSTEIQPYVASIRPSPQYSFFSSLTPLEVTIFSAPTYALEKGNAKLRASLTQCKGACQALGLIESRLLKKPMACHAP